MKYRILVDNHFITEFDSRKQLQDHEIDRIAYHWAKSQGIGPGGVRIIPKEIKTVPIPETKMTVVTTFDDGAVQRFPFADPKAAKAFYDKSMKRKDVTGCTINPVDKKPATA